MSNTDDRLKAGAEQLGGKLKEGAGKVLDDKSLEYEGKADVAKGQAHDASARAQGWAEGKTDEVKGQINEAWGNVTGDTATEAKGEAQKWAGRAEKKANE